MDPFHFPRHAYLYMCSPSFLQRAGMDGLGKCITCQMLKGLPRGSSVPFRARMYPRAHGSQDGHVGTCLGLGANKWPFSDIDDTFSTKPTGGKNPIQLLVPFPRVLITKRLCASLQAAIKHREDWALDLKLFTKFNSKTKKHTRDHFWGQDKKYAWLQRKRSNHHLPRSNTGEVMEASINFQKKSQNHKPESHYSERF